jgi:hypothetical protein
MWRFSNLGKGESLELFWDYEQHIEQDIGWILGLSQQGGSRPERLRKKRKRKQEEGRDSRKRPIGREKGSLFYLSDKPFVHDPRAQRLEGNALTWEFFSLRRRTAPLNRKGYNIRPK